MNSMRPAAPKRRRAMEVELSLWFGQLVGRFVMPDGSRIVATLLAVDTLEESGRVYWTDQGRIFAPGPSIIEWINRDKL